MVINEPTVNFTTDDSDVNFNYFRTFSECLQYRMLRQVCFVIPAFNLTTGGQTGTVTATTATLNTPLFVCGEKTNNVEMFAPSCSTRIFQMFLSLNECQSQPDVSVYCRQADVTFLICNYVVRSSSKVS